MRLKTFPTLFIVLSTNPDFLPSQGQYIVVVGMKIHWIAKFAYPIRAKVCEPKFCSTKSIPLISHNILKMDISYISFKFNA